MNLIPYEQFTIDGNVLKRLQEHYTNRKIKEYFKNHGVMPNSGTVESFVIPPELMNEYKEYYYADYCQKEVELEKKYGPSEMIETTFDFSAVDDDQPSNILGASVSGDDEEYQYEYWNIAIVDLSNNTSFTIGSFTTLDNTTVTLNSIHKYAIYAYHRKSNYQYERVMGHYRLTNYAVDGLPLDYGFTNWEGDVSRYGNTDLSSYLPINGNGWIDYQTQMKDKEYIGIIENYSPQKDTPIRGSVYTFNPRMLVTVSGLAAGCCLELRFGPIGHSSWPEKTVKFTCDSNEQLYTSGDMLKLTRISGTSFSYLLTKDEIAYTLDFNRCFWRFSQCGQINNPQYEMATMISLNRDEELSPYGLWTIDRCDVETSQTILGNTAKSSSTIDFGSEYCCIELSKMNIASLWLNNSQSTQKFVYDDLTKRMTFRNAINCEDNGKSISLLGIYDVIVSGDSLTLQQPEASVGTGGTTEKRTYYLHRNFMKNLEGVTFDGCDIMRRNALTYGTIYIPPQGEDIDTGFDFDVIDD